MADDRSLPVDHEPLNRAERRAQRYRPNAGQPDPHAVTSGAAPDEEGLLPPETTAHAAEEADAVTRSGSGDVTHLTGAGTGGATDSGDRMPHHEGAHFGNQPNG
jgi:hypothetical protein